jgi:hypothetical protein
VWPETRYCCILKEAHRLWVLSKICVPKKQKNGEDCITMNLVFLTAHQAYLRLGNQGVWRGTIHVCSKHYIENNILFGKLSRNRRHGNHNAARRIIIKNVIGRYLTGSEV